MKYIYSISIAFFLYSCTTLEYGLLLESDIEREGNGQMILDQLNDPQSRKGKVFVFSNTQDGLWQFVRVNGTERYMRDQEVQVFDLVDGENNVYAFGRIFGDEVNNCTGEGHSFNSKDFSEHETLFFMIAEPAEREFAGRYFNCYKEVHLTEEGFFYFKDNPRSSRWRKDWILNP
ncbi:MAG: hypothetical protein CMD58_03825 [Gammaproteobacteria bacterium]|nr:hypothetical protein [Gammaproteobacteria bacterium]|tara:strand:+ start:949 stop:1473 length:525 start_codon:yes stop_codon:yes gene_type:complete